MDPHQQSIVGGCPPQPPTNPNNSNDHPDASTSTQDGEAAVAAAADPAAATATAPPAGAGDGAIESATPTLLGVSGGETTTTTAAAGALGGEQQEQVPPVVAAPAPQPVTAAEGVAPSIQSATTGSAVVEEAATTTTTTEPPQQHRQEEEEQEQPQQKPSLSGEQPEKTNADQQQPQPQAPATSGPSSSLAVASSAGESAYGLVQKQQQEQQQQQQIEQQREGGGEPPASSLAAASSVDQQPASGSVSTSVGQTDGVTGTAAVSEVATAAETTAAATNQPPQPSVSQPQEQAPSSQTPPPVSDAAVGHNIVGQQQAAAQQQLQQPAIALKGGNPGNIAPLGTSGGDLPPTAGGAGAGPPPVGGLPDQPAINKDDQQLATTAAVTASSSSLSAGIIKPTVAAGAGGGVAPVVAQQPRRSPNVLGEEAHQHAPSSSLAGSGPAPPHHPHARVAAGLPPHHHHAAMQQQQQGRFDQALPATDLPPPQVHHQQPQHHPHHPHHPVHMQQHQQHPPKPQQPPPQQLHHQAPQPPPQQQQQQGGGPPVDRGMRELRVEDALLYLDHVKMEFKDRPQIYNQFLAIMKNFKSQEVDTPGVIRRVSKLFRGYNNLILGFNTFLPDGFKISLADLQREEREERAREEAAAAATAARNQPQQQGPPTVASVPQQQHRPGGGPPNWSRQPQFGAGGAAPNAAESSPLAHQDPLRKAAPTAATSQPQAKAVGLSSPTKPPQQQVPHGVGGTPAGGSGGAKPQQGQAHQTVEFDHAISYVTTIKRRFANDPSTYHQFLEILHTYQKEQRGIKEVLEQVAHLFQDHPDLLKEFTFFLPDAVQEQAKERLHRAAAESESRQALQRQQQMEKYQQSMSPSARGSGVAAAAPAPPPPPPSSHQKFIDMTRNQAGLSMEPEARGRKRPMEIQQHATSAVPEANVYNSAVERQFFDAAREALSSYSRDGGQAWAEFLKCLDMYAQDILSRNEMLNFVEPLLGKRNNKLFEEFKRILAAAGSPTHPLPLLEDSWHSVPLSEIDFSRCRRCSPSYRALPRDYPAPPCSDRSEAEAKILNDIWVSLPVGSEESYTFRHMRRNIYEETLFRVEDERFEIDMVIDSNAATLHILEPIALEISQLSQEEIALPDLGTKPSVEGAGLGGRRFQYSFDKTILGVIHRNTIVRIYGDSGQEMLDLMVKNPTVAIPIVVQRLRQKDAEWRAVRDRLNRHWMELAQHNYYKSLDNRSLTWRTTDKRATSTRTLIFEIKDRAANGGAEGQEALKQKLDKAKEEHGSFYEVTMFEAMTKSLDLTYLPKPDRRLFTPHLSLMYENNSWAQRDAYRILTFALERGHIAPADKERCHRLWTDFLGPIFGLSLNWMQLPAVKYQESTALPTNPKRLTAANPMVVSEDDDYESMEDIPDLGGNVVTEELRENGESESKEEGFTDHHPLPAGAHVSTLYGEGKVIEFRRSDRMYVVQLGDGSKSYLRPATVLCSILPVEKSPYTRQLRSKDLSRLARPGDHLVIGSQSLYLFFRLHQILIRRLNIAKRLAYSVGDDRSLKTLVEQPAQSSNPKAAGHRRYEAYLSLVYNLLDGGGGGAAEGGKYEDRVRALLGHGAYELATMDKLISHIWKNLQSMAGDESMWNLIQLYRRHLAAGSFQPESFRQEAAYHSEGEPMYAFQYCPTSADSAVLHMESLDVLADPFEDDMDAEDADEGAIASMMVSVAATEPTSNKRQRR